MPERLKQIIPPEIWSFIVKALPVSLAALAISISVQIKNKTATVINVILSIVSGIACSYLTAPFVFDSFGKGAAPIILGVVTITGEKVAYWLIYEFKVDKLMESVLKWAVKKIKK